MNQQSAINNDLDVSPPKKKFASNLTNGHQVRIKTQLNRLKNDFTSNEDVIRRKTTNNLFSQHQATADESQQISSNEIIQNLLLRTLTEILTNQMMLTRKVDLIKENIDSVNKRLIDIELALSSKANNNNNEDAISNCNSETTGFINHHSSRHEKHHHNRKHLDNSNEISDENTNDIDTVAANTTVTSSPHSILPQSLLTSTNAAILLNHLNSLSNQHRRLDISPLQATPKTTADNSTNAEHDYSDNEQNSSIVKHSNNNNTSTTGLLSHHQYPIQIPQTYLAHQNNNNTQLDIDSILRLDKDAENLVPRDVIKRCIRKAKHRGNFAANLAAELFNKDERITCNCTGTRGKKQLSPRRLQLVKDITFQMYACEVSA